MFKLVTIKDTILVPAHLFGAKRLTALEHMVNKRFSDRVIGGHGLCIGLWDFIRVGEDHLVVQSGECSTECTFRLVVFCPFPGEVVYGRISGSHKGGMFVEMGFFDGVHIDKGLLPRPSDFDEKENVWIWRPEIGEGEEEGAGQTLYMDATNECVFRVVECEFENLSRVKPSDREISGNGGVGGAMSIAGGLYDEVLEDNQGLGDPLWWDEGEAEELGDGEEGGDVGEGEWAQTEDGGDGDGGGGENGDVGEGEGVEGEFGEEEYEEEEEEGDEGCGMVDDDDGEE